MKVLDKSTFDDHQKNYDQCLAHTEKVLDHQFVIDGSGRQAQIHTCFLNCKNYIYDDFKQNYTMDTRPNCTDWDAQGGERYLLCLYQDETCEKTVLKEEEGWGTIQFSYIKSLLAIAISTPIQFLFELFCIYLVKVKQNGEKASENCKILTYQLILVGTYMFLLFKVVQYAYDVLEYGRPGMVFTSFIVALMVDQLKSIPALGLIYCVVVRRFMHLDVNENSYIDPNAEKIPKQENQIPKLKLFCLKFLESTYVELFSMFIISIYTLFVLFWLTY